MATYGPQPDVEELLRQLRQRLAALGGRRIAAGIAGALLLIFLLSTWFTVQPEPNPNALIIKPRLEYCMYLINRILPNLQNEYERVRDSNHKSYSCNELTTDNPEFRKQVAAESSLACAIEALHLVENKLASVSQLSNIAEILPLVSIIRTVNSAIYSIVPNQSGDFVELSGILGSIVMDSGSLVEATFDFKQTNLESKQILTEVNLIVDSKINKQYPNLNF